MKKILFLGALNDGGKERRMCELIRYLKSANTFDIYLITFKDPGKSYISYDFILDYVTHYTIDRSLSRSQTYKELGTLISTIDPDIVHDWMGPRSAFYLNPRLPFRPYKYIAGYLADANPDRLFNKIILKCNYAFADCIISNSMAGVVAHLAPKKKSIVVYNGFNSDRLPDKDILEGKKAELGIRDEYVITMAARIDKAKDFHMFCDVALKVGKEIPNTLFLIVGRGKMEEEIKEYVRQNDIHNIRFLGFRTDVLDIFALSSISVLCSNSDVHAEGVSNSIMESMACGTPVIATDGGGTPEIIDDNVNGYIVKPHAVDEMADKIKDLLLDSTKLNEFGQNAEATVREKFSIENMVAQYVKIYDDLLEN